MKSLNKEAEILKRFTRAEMEALAEDAATTPVDQYFKKHPVQLQVLIKIVEIAIVLTFAKPTIQLSLKALLVLLKAQQQRNYIDPIIY